MASLKEVQSLLGKLNFVAACVRPGRFFILRMLKWLKFLYREEAKFHSIPLYVKKAFFGGILIYLCIMVCQ